MERRSRNPRISGPCGATGVSRTLVRRGNYRFRRPAPFRGPWISSPMSHRGPRIQFLRPALSFAPVGRSGVRSISNAVTVNMMGHRPSRNPALPQSHIPAGDCLALAQFDLTRTQKRPGPCPGRFWFFKDQAGCSLRLSPVRPWPLRRQSPLGPFRCLRRPAYGQSREPLRPRPWRPARRSCRCPARTAGPSGSLRP